MNENLYCECKNGCDEEFPYNMDWEFLHISRHELEGMDDWRYRIVITSHLLDTDFVVEQKGNYSLIEDK